MASRSPQVVVACAWWAAALCALLLGGRCLADPVVALDTSAGVGLQDRALFQERVDYTLTNQSDGDFHGQVLTNTSFAGLWGGGLTSRVPICTGRSSRKGPLLRRISAMQISLTP